MPVVLHSRRLKQRCADEYNNVANSLKTIRNTVAQGQEAVDRVINAGAVRVLAGVAEQLLNDPSGTESQSSEQSEDTRLVTLAVQAMANLASASPLGAQQAWTACWPTVMVSMLRHQQDKVHEPATMLLFGCARGVDKAVDQLLITDSKPAQLVWETLLARGSNPLDTGSQLHEPSNQADVEELTDRLADMLNNDTSLACADDEQNQQAANTNLSIQGRDTGTNEAAGSSLASQQGTGTQDAAGPQQGCSEWAALLVSYICVQQGCLGRLVSWLSQANMPPCLTQADEGSRAGETCQQSFSHLVVIMLHLLATELGVMQAKHSKGEASWAGWKTCMNELVQILHQSAQSCGLLEQQQAQQLQARQLTKSFAPGVLEATLECLRMLVSREDHGAGITGNKDTDEVEDLLCDAANDLPMRMLGLLTSLQPVQNPRRAQREQQGATSKTQESDASTSSAEQQQSISAVQQPQLSQSAATTCSTALKANYIQNMPVKPPYTGYRGDLLAVISNMMYGRPAVAEMIAKVPGAVTLMLSQCQLDDQSPLAREWAMWGVRNLCGGSPTACQIIADLQPVGSVQSPEMADMGLKLDLNKATGKWEVTNTRQGQAAQHTDDAT